MRVLFAAPVEGNTGPSNANRCFFVNWPQSDDVRQLSKGSKVARLLGAARNALWCDVVVSSGPGAIDAVVSSIARARRVPVLGYCHGYAPFENEVNELGLPESQMRTFVDWLDGVDIVATNSDLQRRFLEERQPSLIGKVESTLLGVEPFRIPGPRGSHKGSVVVAVSGGTRPIKGNDVVARGALLLKERGVDVDLRVYGRSYAPNRELDELVEKVGSYRGQVPQDAFAAELQQADVFVMNSRHEPFGLSAMDALAAGCSLLLSENCGVKEVFATEPSDVVSDCEDAEEVADKISYLAQHPNAERLYRSIDFNTCSWAAAADRLRNVCACVVERKERQ